jgi:transcriptional regulator with XRE-family HTH domain
MVRERGSGITPVRIVDLLQKELKSKSKLSIAKATGIGIAAISRYAVGVGEPTTATLQKLSEYFEMPVEWLRGEDYVDFWGEVYGGSLTDKQKEELSYEFWRKKAGNSSSSPIMVEIFRCLVKVPSEVRYAAFALFRSTCRTIEKSSREELMRLALNLPMGANMPTVSIPDSAFEPPKTKP